MICREAKFPLRKNIMFTQAVWNRGSAWLRSCRPGCWGACGAVVVCEFVAVMSDDEDSAPKIKKQRIHFGSLEEVEKERISSGDHGDTSGATVKETEQDADTGNNANTMAPSGVLAGIKAGNINISDGKDGYRSLEPERSFYQQLGSFHQRFKVGSPTRLKVISSTKSKSIIRQRDKPITADVRC